MEKTASLVFFYFGEKSYVNRLAQETVPLWKALEGYDHKVLLRHETDVGPFELSEAAEKEADVLDLPTKENLAAQLNRLREEGYVVDVFIFAHGWKDKFLASNGTYGDDTVVTQKWLESQVIKPLKIRIVWQCNCYGSTMNDAWANLGAKAAAGSKFVSFYPTRFSGFIKRWRAGVTFAGALTRSETKLVHTPAQAYILTDAVARMKEWDANLWQATKVLGNNDHSRRYFSTLWNNPEDVPNGMSGRQIMNDSSKMVVEGNGRITRNSKLTWDL